MSRVSSCLIHAVWSTGDVPSPLQMTGNMEQERMEHSPCSDRIRCAPVGKYAGGCGCVVQKQTLGQSVWSSPSLLSLTACCQEYTSGSYNLFILWPWYVPQHLLSLSQAVCQADFCVPIHQGMAEKIMLAYPFCEQATHVAGLVPEETLPEELVKTGRTGRNASTALAPKFLCGCLGSRNLWRQMFAVLSNTSCQVQALTGHGERMRKFKYLSKNRIRPLLSTLPVPASKKQSGNGPCIPPLGTEWMGIGEGWHILRHCVHSPLYLCHPEDMAGAFRRYLESWQWEHRKVYKDTAICLVFLYALRQCGNQGRIKSI